MLGWMEKPADPTRLQRAAGYGGGRSTHLGAGKTTLQCQLQMATISSDKHKPSSFTALICIFLASRAMSVAEPLPPPPVFLSCCRLCGPGRNSLAIPQLHDASSWQQSTEGLHGAGSTPGPLGDATACVLQSSFTGCCWGAQCPAPPAGWAAGT